MLSGVLVFFADLLQTGRSWVEGLICCCCFAVVLAQTSEDIEEKGTVKKHNRELQEKGKQSNILCFRLGFLLVTGQSSFLVGHSRLQILNSLRPYRDLLVFLL